MDGCDRAISYISPKTMAGKGVYIIMDMLARIGRLQLMREDREEEARECDVEVGRWDRVSGRERATHRNAPTTFEILCSFDSQGNQGFVREAYVVSESGIRQMGSCTDNELMIKAKANEVDEWKPRYVSSCVEGDNM